MISPVMLPLAVSLIAGTYFYYAYKTKDEALMKDGVISSSKNKDAMIACYFISGVLFILGIFLNFRKKNIIVAPSPPQVK